VCHPLSLQGCAKLSVPECNCLPLSIHRCAKLSAQKCVSLYRYRVVQSCLHQIVTVTIYRYRVYKIVCTAVQRSQLITTPACTIDPALNAAIKINLSPTQQCSSAPVQAHTSIQINWLENIFEPNRFLYKNSNILKPSYPSHLTAYADGTGCSET
jgi:hypothetical protein